MKVLSEGAANWSDDKIIINATEIVFRGSSDFISRNYQRSSERGMDNCMNCELVINVGGFAKKRRAIRYIP